MEYKVVYYFVSLLKSHQIFQATSPLPILISLNNCN